MTSPKPYELTFEKRPDYLYARIKAPALDRATALDYLGEIADRCAATRCKRLLVDRNIPAATTDADAVLAIKDYVRMSAGLRVAFVNRRSSGAAAFKQLVEACA